MTIVFMYASRPCNTAATSATLWSSSLCMVENSIVYVWPSAPAPATPPGAVPGRAAATADEVPDANEAWEVEGRKDAVEGEEGKRLAVEADADNNAKRDGCTCDRSRVFGRGCGMTLGLGS